VIKATAGTWGNYALTLVFQVLFAAHYGTGLAASGFVIAFGAIVSLAGILISGVQSVIIPRILTESGAFVSQSVKFLVGVAALALMLAVVIALSADEVGRFAAQMLGLPTPLFVDLLRLSSMFLFLQVVGGELAAVAVARGQRLMPALAPVFPSLLGCIALVTYAHLDIRLTYLALVAGSVVQIAAVAIGVGRFRFAFDPIGGFGWTALGMAAVYGLLALIPPMERVLAATHGASSAAQYDYAMRSLRAVQQLILGGLFLAALGDWSSHALTVATGRLKASLVSAACLAGVLLVLAASLALVLGRDLVAVLYQHGRFLSTDTAAVTVVLILALPGFCSEGIGLIVSSALLARKRNRTLMAIGTSNFGLRAVLLLLLGPPFGAPGVAIAYSITASVFLLVLIMAARRNGLWPSHSEVALYRAGFVTIGTVASACIVFAVGGAWPPFMSASIVVGVFAVLFLRFQPVPTPRLLPR